MSSLQCDRQELVERAVNEAKAAREQGWESLTAAHKERWAKIWEETDVEIKGDPEAQQGIRFNIFQLNQSYQGDDERLNIGPKGFTGEKYGGNTQWNTELCCAPDFLLSTPREVCRKLLLYRYNQLPKAIENARKLGFTDGAALDPMATIHGEECHNEWGNHFRRDTPQQHHSICHHAVCQGDRQQRVHCPLRTGGDDRHLPVLEPAGILLAGTAKICAVGSDGVKRVRKQRKQQLVHQLLLRAMPAKHHRQHRDGGPRISGRVCTGAPCHPLQLCRRDFALGRRLSTECISPGTNNRASSYRMTAIRTKELTTVDDIPANQRPINQWWSWDRILRSCYIKQSDVLLGLFLDYQNFDRETILRNFRFYEPRTVHQSSLSPFVHAILAAWIGDTEEAYRLFLHATCLHLDDYNNVGTPRVAHHKHGGKLAGHRTRICGNEKILDAQPTSTPSSPKRGTAMRSK